MRRFSCATPDTGSKEITMPHTDLYQRNSIEIELRTLRREWNELAAQDENAAFAEINARAELAHMQVIQSTGPVDNTPIWEQFSVWRDCQEKLNNVHEQLFLNHLARAEFLRQQVERWSSAESVDNLFSRDRPPKRS